MVQILTASNLELEPGHDKAMHSGQVLVLSPVAHNSLSLLLQKPESGSSGLAFLTLCSFNSTSNQSRRANPASSFESMPCAQPIP